jgi:hypothetical protein
MAFLSHHVGLIVDETTLLSANASSCNRAQEILLSSDAEVLLLVHTGDTLRNSVPVSWRNPSFTKQVQIKVDP